MSIALATVFPAISYRRLTTDLPGTGRGLAGPIRPRVRINAWHRDHDSACAVSSAILAAFADGGVIRSPQVPGFVLGLLLPEDAGDEYFEPQDASKDFLFGPFVDFRISYGNK